MEISTKTVSEVPLSWNCYVVIPGVKQLFIYNIAVRDDAVIEVTLFKKYHTKATITIDTQGRERIPEGTWVQPDYAAWLRAGDVITTHKGQRYEITSLNLKVIRYEAHEVEPHEMRESQTAELILCADPNHPEVTVTGYIYFSILPEEHMKRLAAACIPDIPQKPKRASLMKTIPEAPLARGCMLELPGVGNYDIRDFTKEPRSLVSIRLFTKYKEDVTITLDTQGRKITTTKTARGYTLWLRPGDVFVTDTDQKLQIASIQMDTAYTAQLSLLPDPLQPEVTLTGRICFTHLNDSDQHRLWEAYYG